MKRQSTTAKVTIATATLIERDCEAGISVIIRYRGKELGCVGVVRAGKRTLFKVRETSALIPRENCTIRKDTLPHLGRGTSLVVNVGCNTTRIKGTKTLPVDHVDRIVGSSEVWSELPVFDTSVGTWQGVSETTVVARGRTELKLADVDSQLALLCRIAGQDCIAYRLDGVGHLAYHRDFVDRYDFDPTCFAG